MPFTVGGEEVATGAADPTTMFVAVGAILGVGFIATIAYGIYLTMSK